MEVERVPIRSIPIDRRAGDSVQLNYNGTLFCIHERTYRVLCDLNFEMKVSTINDIVAGN